MARLSDHDLRDAEHRIRAEFRLELGRYIRRMDEAGKALVKTMVEQQVREGKEIDGPAIGKAVAKQVIASYFAGSKPEPAIESGTPSSTRQLKGGTGDYTAGDRPGSPRANRKS